MSCRQTARIILATTIGIFAVLLFLIPKYTILHAQTIEELKRDIELKEAEIKKLEAEAEQYRQELMRSANRSRTLKAELSRIDAIIKQLSYKLSITKAQLEATTLEIKKLNLKIGDTESVIYSRKSQIAEAMRALNYLDQMGFLNMMLGSRNISDIFEQAISLINLENHLNNQLILTKQLKSDLETDLKEAEMLKQKYLDLKSDLSAQNLIEQNKRQDRYQLLIETKNQESRFQQLLIENEKKQEAIQKEIYEIESVLRRLALKATVPPRNPGLFAWPIKEDFYVTQGYGETSRTGFINDFYKFHNGIDFGTKTGVGTPVRAVFDGVVSAIGDNGRYAYGKWVAVRHNNGLTTLYAHLALIKVSVGTAVQKGTVVGYMGSTGFVTGPHLHFSVFATETFRVESRSFGKLPLGGSLDPLDYLPTG